MELTSEQQIAVQSWFDKWRKAKGRKKKELLSELPEVIGIERTGAFSRDDYEGSGQFSYPPDDRDFDPDSIYDSLSPARYEKLSDGGKPTKQELEIWREKKIEDEFMGDGGWWHYFVWRIDIGDQSLYFLSLHGDGGIMDGFRGPYHCHDEALDGGTVGPISWRGNE
jgi:hypothetical protein